jgi:hypothetical protein
MKCLAAVLLTSAFFANAASAAEAVCLRGDSIDRVKMVGEATAAASDRQNRQFDITFVAPCGARHQNVFFILKPESLPVCIIPGTALKTNTEGVCVVKSISPRS